jgi:hypothetical protein
MATRKMSWSPSVDSIGALRQHDVIGPLEVQGERLAPACCRRDAGLRPADRLRFCELDLEDARRIESDSKPVPHVRDEHSERQQFHGGVSRLGVSAAGTRLSKQEGRLHRTVSRPFLER